VVRGHNLRHEVMEADVHLFEIAVSYLPARREKRKKVFPERVRARLAVVMRLQAGSGEVISGRRAAGPSKFAPRIEWTSSSM